MSFKDVKISTDALTDEDMKNSQQELPPEDMLEKIKKEIKKAQN